ncbi:MAG: hypothetical protein IJS22_07785 [Lachnospiraceae bacterium]|nr:hypothetical protein [Lachnospiraceae bacterium]
MRTSVYRRAFTVAEMLITVSVITILSVLAAVSLRSIRLESRTREADETARNIYITAQNRIGELRLNHSGESMERYGHTMDETPSDFDYWSDVSGYDRAALIEYTFGDTGNCRFLDSMDEEDSAFVDGTLLDGSSVLVSRSGDDRFFIEYNAEAMAVYGVIYADTDAPLDYAHVAAYLNRGGRRNGDISEKDARHYRQTYVSGDQQVILGYYGGGIVSDVKSISLDAPVVSVSNGEDLMLEIYDPNTAGTDLSFKIVGVQSGCSREFSIDKNSCMLKSGDTDRRIGLCALTSDGTPLEIEYARFDEDGIFETGIVLDSLVFLGNSGNEPETEGCHISEIMGDGFIPGEDLCISVTVSPAGDYLALPVCSQVTVNSLFERAVNGTLEVTAIRHLQNISGAVSGFDPGVYSGGKTLRVILGEDLSYSGRYPENDQVTRDYCDLLYGICMQDGSGKDAFVPIDCVCKVNLAGCGRKIYDLCIGGGFMSCQGLFGRAEDLEITSLGIVGSGLALSTPLLYLQPDTVCAGAFAGSAGMMKISECYSTMRISGKSSLPDNVCIGGFIGKAGEYLDIRRSYCGGYAPGGMYDHEFGNLDTKGSGCAAICMGGFAGMCGDDGLDTEVCVGSSYSVQSLKAVMTDDCGEIRIGGFIGCVVGESIHIELDEMSYHTAPVIVGGDRVFAGGIIGTVEAADSDEAINSIFADCFFDEVYSNKDVQTDSRGIRSSLRGLKELYEGLLLDASETYPVSEGLKGKRYPYPDMTELGHHYGDWQDTLPVCTVSIAPGRGIESLGADEWDTDSGTIRKTFEYGEEIRLEYLKILRRPGYCGTRITGLPEEIEHPDTELSVITAGLEDLDLVCSASGLLPPEVSLPGGGRYSYHYDTALLPVLAAEMYPDDGSISIHYEISCHEEGCDDCIVRSVDRTLDSDTEKSDGSWLVDIFSIGPDEYIGVRTYTLRAYVYDGVYRSEYGSYGPVEVCFEKQRQRITFYSGWGWFYD